ncbi:hypothetical protein CYPRO_0846 [Cyclonatronum proteinivorum]|uniref:Uncharacterized protein n=1 Tax=Cyclonatronum proteinivorum TaxID=1457365 RepID=A0A345UI21_9BACT|nr:hypothetical protein CYPRO_0846 [Cyclonatronum proteinivorum]
MPEPKPALKACLHLKRRYHTSCPEVQAHYLYRFCFFGENAVNITGCGESSGHPKSVLCALLFCYGGRIANFSVKTATDDGLNPIFGGNQPALVFEQDF